MRHCQDGGDEKKSPRVQSILEELTKPETELQKMNKEDLREVTHPDHYMMSGVETFEEMILTFGVEAVKTYCKLAAWKYRARAPYKGAQEKDMAKAAWYMQKLKELS